MRTFLTSQEMHDLIDVDRSTAYRMAEDGRLRGVKIGRQWRFPAGRGQQGQVLEQTFEAWWSCWELIRTKQMSGIASRS